MTGRDAYDAALNLIELGLSNEAFRMGCLLTADAKEVDALIGMWPVLADEVRRYATADAQAALEGHPEESTEET